MSLPPPLLDWFASVENLDVVLSGNAREDAVANTLVFAAKEAQSAAVQVVDMDRFLLDAFRELCRKLAGRETSAWFYSWYDEMSGTLRCSVAAVETSTALPFSCALQVTDKPTPVSEAALSSSYATGIPLEELAEDAWGESDEEPAFTLTVFARPLMRTV